MVFALEKGMKHIPLTFKIYCVLFLGLMLAGVDVWAYTQFLPVADGATQLAQRINLFRSQVNPNAFPLLTNAILNKVAQDHCADMVSRLYFSNIDPDGRDSMARAVLKGYSLRVHSSDENQQELGLRSGLITETISGLVVNFPLPAADAMEGIWADLLNQHLPFANPDMLEMGVAFGVAQVSLNGVQFYVYLASVVVARPSIQAPYVFQCGHVFTTRLANSIFSPAEFETVSAPNISIVNLDNGSVLAVTDANGAYCFTAPRFSSLRYGVCGSSFLKTYPVDETLLFTVDIRVDCIK